MGGLRGAVTLALALSVTENPDLDSDSKDFVADLATGFALFTLLFNGLTLRPVIRLLKLDRLSPLNQAIRDKVLALSLADVREVIRHAAQTYRIAPATARAASQHYEQRIKELESQPSLENAISDQDWIRIGLIALANRERRIILDHHEQNTVSGVAIERLLRNTNLILDAARTEGRRGYDQAARELLAFPRGFRIAHFLHRTAHIDAPLRRELSIRFETLLVLRLALEELAVFTQKRLRAVFGPAAAQMLGDVITSRTDATTGVLDALRLQYPKHADHLEQRFLQQSGFRLLSSRYRRLFEEGLIGGELLSNLEREHEATRSRSAREVPLDLGLETRKLIDSLEVFGGLPATELEVLVRLFRPRLLLPNEMLIRKGERGRAMFFISSGAVEVQLPTERVRLGSGEFVGEMALLSHRPRQADVVSLGYGTVLVLAAADFERFLSKYPDAKAEIEQTAAARAAG